MEFLSRCFPFIHTDGRADFSLKIIYYRERSDLINAQINTVGGESQPGSYVRLVVVVMTN